MQRLHSSKKRNEFTALLDCFWAMRGIVSLPLSFDIVYKHHKSQPSLPRGRDKNLGETRLEEIPIVWLVEGPTVLYNALPYSTSIPSYVVVGL